MIDFIEKLREAGQLGGIAKGLAYEKKRNSVRADYLNGCYDMEKLATKYNLSISTVYKYVQHFRSGNTYNADQVLKEIIAQNEILEAKMEKLKLMQRANAKTLTATPRTLEAL